ncbi:MAG: GxxExxY protein [Phycisphaeraceae bacterium]|nr:GxxExxY protein [Phycisphaeraceae bacterium]
MEREGRQHLGPSDVPAEWNRLTELVIGAAMEVHSELGPGLLEKFYELAFCRELEMRGISYSRQHPIRLEYKGIALGDQYADLVVADLIVVELKAVERISDVHLAQLTSYMRSACLPLGLLFNFNVARLKDGMYRRVHSKDTPVPTTFLDAHPRMEKEHLD